MEQVLYKDERGFVSKVRKPEWASDPKNMLSKEDVEKFANATLVIPPRMMFEGQILRADVVNKDNRDLIFHFQDIKHPDFKNLLAEVVESHFGSTDRFKVDQVHEIPGLWGLLAEGVLAHPLFNLKFYTEDFLALLDQVLVDVRQR